MSSTMHLPWSGPDLSSAEPYRGLTACGLMVSPESMGCYGGHPRLTCPDCRDDTAKFAPRRAAALREYLAKVRPQRPLDTCELRTLVLKPSDQDVRVNGTWTQRGLDELLAMSARRQGTIP